MALTRSYKSLEVTPATPTIGANVTGIDLSRPITPEQVAEIRRALLDHQVLFFRDQKRIEPALHIELGQQFGKLHMHPTLPHLEGFPGILVVHADENSKGHFGPMWHSDVSCDAEPPMATMLQIHTPPPCGGDTLFAGMYAAYADLSPAMQRFLQGLAAQHQYPFGIPSPSDPPAPRAEHPIVRTHPETGRHALYVSRLFTTYIVGLSPGESRSLLSHLFAHIENPYYHVRVNWQKNDVAFWDNRCTQHLAIWDYKPHTRTGHRVTIQGDKPFFRPDPSP
ncbi:MAG: TauD/TfdA family dioxygenase [Planctomycetes bacterium]|nr:TauD/TfdA family dioxygenase [Planctomycetota bacterium]